MERDLSALYSILGSRPILRVGAIGAFLLVAACAAPACSRGEPSRPDVLLVVIENLRADRVSAAGYGRATTPAIDALATSGTLFESAVTASSWGVAAQASILTGLFPSEHGVLYERPVLDTPAQSLAERLKGVGYETWAASTDPAISVASRFGRGFDRFETVDAAGAGAPDQGAAAAEAFFLEWQKDRPDASTRPFFAYVVLSEPKLPFNPPDDYGRRFQPAPMPRPALEQLTQLWVPFARQYSLDMVKLEEQQTAALRALYDGEVAYADYRLGRMIEGLREAGRLDRTLVVVTSDAGDDLGDHGLLSDASYLFDTIVRVPLVMRLPGSVPAGRRVPDQVQTLDLFDTILGLTSEPPAPQPPPTIMVPRAAAVIEARVDPGALRYYRTLVPEGDFSFLERNLLAVRTRELKYLVTSTQLQTLFDLASDPGETSSALETHPDRALEMAALLDQWASSLRRIPVAAGASAPEAAGQVGTPTEPR